MSLWLIHVAYSLETRTNCLKLSSGILFPEVVMVLNFNN